ncbi:hypothetical protein BASA81_010515 [Batrachochytrium salamandrivorans]|nr:hypothetical protein BASA81_010515 [Batrachochytrium salamandrivorans]
MISLLQRLVVPGNFLKLTLQKTVSPKCLLVYDGRKIAYSMYEMADQTVELDVPKDDNMVLPPIQEAGGGGGYGSDRGGRGGGRGGGG